MSVIDFAAFTERLAQASGDVILPYFRTALTIEDKPGKSEFDPVTEADRAAEAVMRRMIEQAFPQHGVVGEEFGETRTDAEYVWVLDPIDGTKSFVAGMPVWGTLIGLTHRGIPVFGMMHQPYLGERFTGNGNEAHCSSRSGRRRLRVRECASLSEATLFTTSPRLIDEPERARFSKVEERCRLSRYGGDCYAYCMLAAGHIDLVIETGLKPYDIAALIPIVTGAGGIVTTWDGASAQDGGRIIAASDARIHAAAMELLRD